MSSHTGHKLPRTPLQMYIKIYFRKRNGYSSKKHEAVQNEAIKSWTSLNTLEKEQFIDKYMKWKVKNFANILKESEVYMKKKELTLQKPERIIRADGEPNDSKVEEQVPNELSNNNFSISTNIHDSTEHLNRLDHVATTVVSVLDNTTQQNEVLHLQETQKLQDHERKKVIKPSPPNTRSGKELFELIKGVGSEVEDWNKLPPTEKRLYQNAVLTLKKDFITQYTLYLESLSSRELFNFYNENII